MRVEWIEAQNKHRMSAEVLITYSNKLKVMTIAFTAGTLATKFGHSEKIAVGFDEYNSRFCFMGGPKGYKISRAQNGVGRIKIHEKKIIPHCAPHELCGNYILKKDEDGYYYISIGMKR